MSMFCENCKTLLKTRRMRGQIETYCPKCQGNKEDKDEMTAPPEPAVNITYEKHPNIPYFPHPEVREGQDMFMKDVRGAIKKGKHLVAYAPTGIGKTVGVLAPAVQEALKSGKTVFFLTSKQSQHSIAIETLRMINGAFDAKILAIDIISKQAMCPRDIALEHHAAFNLMCKASIKNKTCKYFSNTDARLIKKIPSQILHVEELKRLAVGRHLCPHKIALKAAAASNVIICDYNYIFNTKIRESILESLGKSLGDLIVIIDEAHNLPDRVRGQLTMGLTMNMITEAISEVRDNKRLALILKEIKKELSRIFATVEPGEEKLTSSDALLAKVEMLLSGSLFEKMGLDDLITGLRKLGEVRMARGSNSSAVMVAEFLEGFKQEMEGLIRIISHKDGSRLYFRLLDPSVLTTPLFEEIHSSILMSGTLYPTKMFADILGVPEKSRVLRSYTSPFPKENRPVYVADDVTTLYKERTDAMYRKIAKNIDNACSEVPGNAAVFFPSYSLLKQIRYELETGKSVIQELQSSTKEQKGAIIQKLNRLKHMGGGVLLAVMGGSLSEGIDYKNNLLDCVMVVGIPFAPPSLEQQQLIQYYDRKFGKGYGREYGYTSPAINRVLQATGRCIRSETDRAVVILLDKRFNYPAYQKLFPKELGISRSPDLTAELRKFYAV